MHMGVLPACVCVHVPAETREDRTHKAGATNSHECWGQNPSPLEGPRSISLSHLSSPLH